MKILRIGTPYYSEFDCVKSSLKTLENRIFDFQFETVQIQGTYIAQARNMMVQHSSSSLRKQQIIDRDFLFIDSDISFTYLDIEKIHNLSEKHPVIFFPYITHADHNSYQCGEWRNFTGIIGNKYPIKTKGLKKISWCGAGFLYVKKEIMESINYPYFRSYVMDIGPHSVQVGEDIGFCIQLAEKKIPIYCDFDNPVSHKLRS